MGDLGPSLSRSTLPSPLHLRPPHHLHSHSHPHPFTLISTLISTHLRPLRLLREACRSFVRELYVFALSEWAYSQVSRYVARSIADTITLVGRPVTQSVSK